MDNSRYHSLIPVEKRRAVDKVIKFFKQTNANYMNQLAYTGEKFLTKKDGDWLAIEEKSAQLIAYRNLNAWFRDFGELDEYEKELLGGVAPCPTCNEVDVLDALSRKDNKTLICSHCGTMEAIAEIPELM